MLGSHLLGATDSWKKAARWGSSKTLHPECAPLALSHICGREASTSEKPHADKVKQQGQDGKAPNQEKGSPYACSVCLLPTVPKIVLTGKGEIFIGCSSRITKQGKRVDLELAQ